MATQIGQDVVDRKGHVADRILLHDLAVQVGAQGLQSDVDAADQAGPDWAVTVLTFHPQHRTGIGVAKVVQADIVRRHESGNVVPYVVGLDVAHRPGHDDSDLALVVEVLAVGGAIHDPPMGIERRQRLLEVGRRGEGLGPELDSTAVVVEMDAQDLGRVTGRHVTGTSLVEAPTVVEQQFGSVVGDRHPLRRTAVEDATDFPSRTVQHVGHIGGT